MTVKQDTFKDFVLDQLRGLGRVTCRAMFGGYALYLGRSIFGILHKGRLYFKVTPATLSRYTAQGMQPFHPNRTHTLTSYHEVPTDVIEEAEQLTEWAKQAADQ